MSLLCPVTAGVRNGGDRRREYPSCLLLAGRDGPALIAHQRDSEMSLVVQNAVQLNLQIGEFGTLFTG